MTVRRHKEAIRNFMRTFYSDQNLASLLAFARDGKLQFQSCCCFIGIPTATHSLRQKPLSWETQHYLEAKELPGANSAEHAFMMLGGPPEVPWGDFERFLNSPQADAKRRRILIPMVRAEMKRRDFIRASTGIRQETVVSLAV